jgi:hypothetical protein
MKNRATTPSLAICCVFLFLSLFVTRTHAQFDSLGINTEWTSGIILLDNNTTLKGLVQFNDKLGMIKYKEARNSVEESFVETSVTSMQLMDDKTGSWRNFAVFNVYEEKTGWKGALLFEVLMEFRSFALVTRVEPVKVATRTRQDMFGNYYTARVGYEQYEKFCLVDEEGIATVVLGVSEFERNAFAIAGKLKPYIDKQVLEKYIADDWSEFQAFVKANKLNLRRRADFLRAFEHYREQIEGGS